MSLSKGVKKQRSPVILQQTQYIKGVSLIKYFTMNNLSANNLKGVFTTRIILSAGLLVGILDGIAAIISYLVKGGKHPDS